MSLPRRVWSAAAIVLTAALVRGYAGPVPAGVPVCERRAIAGGASRPRRAANLLAVGGHLGWRSLLLVAYAAALGVAVTLIAGPGARSRQSGGADSDTSPAPSPASANGWDEADAPRMPNR